MISNRRLTNFPHIHVICILTFINIYVYKLNCCNRQTWLPVFKRHFKRKYDIHMIHIYKERTKANGFSNVIIPSAFLFHLYFKAKVVGNLFLLIVKIKVCIPKLFQYFGNLNVERFFFFWWKDHITPLKSGFMMAFSNSTMHGASVILFDPQKNSFGYIMESPTEFSSSAGLHMYYFIHTHVCPCDIFLPKLRFDEC